MLYSVIQKSKLEGAQRIDAEFYQPEYFIDFSKGKWGSIGKFLDTCQYGISQSMNEDSIGYPIFRMDDIKNSFLVDDELKFVDIPESVLKDYKLLKNDLLFNRVNSEEFVGRTGIFKLNGIFVFASYLIRLRVKENGEILPDYLNIFLNSAYGLRQIKKYRRRAVNQANVNAEELKKIKIAILSTRFQKEVQKTCDDIWNQFELSKSLYSQAEQLLLEELGLKDFAQEDDLFYTARLSEVQAAQRVDAEYFSPKVAKLINRLQEYGIELKPFSDVIQNVPAKFEPAKEPDKEFKYVELSNINSTIGVIDGYSQVSGKEAPSRAKRILKAGDVVVSSVEGSLEKVALVDKEQEGYLASTGFFQLRSRELLPEVILVLAKSAVMQMQLKRLTAGTILTAVPKEAVKTVMVPLLSKPVQTQIASLINKSHEARKRAKGLLEEAKRKVEEEIEKQSA